MFMMSGRETSLGGLHPMAGSSLTSLPSAVAGSRPIFHLSVAVGFSVDSALAFGVKKKE